MKVKDYDAEYSIPFEVMLQEAEAFASAAWDMDFISDLRDKYDVYGENMYISEKQIEHLERIANL